MKEVLFSSRRVFILILILVTLGVVFIVGVKEKSQKNFQSLVGQAEEAADQGKLALAYQKQVKKILSDYFFYQENSPLNLELDEEEKSDWLNLAGDIKSQLLDLRLPAEYKDLHLDLVLGFNSLDRGLAEDNFILIAEARVKIDNLIIKYPWLVK